SGAFSAPELGQLTFTNIVTTQHAIWIGLTKLLSIVFILNLILFIFNLFPFPPLDGSGVITLFMSDKLAWKYKQFMSQPAFSFLGIILAWRLFGYVFKNVFLFALNLIHPGIIAF
ncbi:MAG: site-2 protease family protein, partial [bacterium]